MSNLDLRRHAGERVALLGGGVAVRHGRVARLLLLHRQTRGHRSRRDDRWVHVSRRGGSLH